MVVGVSADKCGWTACVATMLPVLSEAFMSAYIPFQDDERRVRACKRRAELRRKTRHSLKLLGVERARQSFGEARSANAAKPAQTRGLTGFDRAPRAGGR